ncbi:MAG: LysM peptidoglycan-binding domain-containing protein [Victivallales bacterium]|jgi:LysM repeat protein|nr:LysM peptidoglycan-binding domain-containing protein [Victivallales bacterium]MBR6324614.1 LysM peptidoglycan-binding domain-containing protein [Victivallales bacterium]
MKMKINVIRAGLLALVVMGATWSANGQDMRSLVREFAQLRADMRILQEDQKVLLDRITVLSQENVAKDAQIAELQKMLTMQETRIQGIEKDLIMRLEQLRKALESEQVSRRKDLETAVGSMAAEISKLDKVATNASAVANAASAAAARRQQPPPPAYSGSYKEIDVKRGDTLSVIAQAVGVPISTLRQINNLKSDTIFVGQKLKIPVVQK